MFLASIGVANVLKMLLKVIPLVIEYSPLQWQMNYSKQLHNTWSISLHFGGHLGQSEITHWNNHTSIASPYITFNFWYCDRRIIYRISGNIDESKIWCFDAKWILVNLADCSVQCMKLCTFIILVEFKFGIMDPICQIAKLKSSPKFQRIQYNPRW